VSKTGARPYSGNCDFLIPDRFTDETPRHRVYLDAFYINRFEVTVGLYERFVKDMEAQGSLGPTLTYPHEYCYRCRSGGVGMRRREFIAGTISMAAVSPLVAQPVANSRRLAIFSVQEPKALMHERSENRYYSASEK
jgi:formylglycine-generating enzyme required for sulfatase activity